MVVAKVLSFQSYCLRIHVVVAKVWVVVAECRNIDILVDILTAKVMLLGGRGRGLDYGEGEGFIAYVWIIHFCPGFRLSLSCDIYSFDTIVERCREFLVQNWI